VKPEEVAEEYNGDDHEGTKLKELIHQTLGTVSDLKGPASGLTRAVP
jgi:hypothetical protein